MSQPHAVITDEMIANLRSRIGQVWTPREPFFNTQAVRDTIRHFVDGIGDRNPLYRDPQYARNTRYGRLTAPGCFLFSVYYPIARGSSMPGIHGLIGEINWEWFKPILEGDEFTYSDTLTDIQETRGKISDRIVVGRDIVEYRNQHGEVVAIARGCLLNFERGRAGEKGSYRHREMTSYTPEELQKIHDDYASEVVRGATPRYWEDVEVGDELGHVIKGPLSQRDMMCWNMGAGSQFMRAHGRYVDYLRRHPATPMFDSTTGRLDVPELVHFEDTRAREIGVTAAFDYGYERVSWHGNLLTNWAGDEAFVKKMDSKLTAINYVGDTTWFRGRVTKKYLDENGEPCVDIDSKGENQRGETTLIGQASVILPSREKGTSPLDKRLQ